MKKHIPNQPLSEAQIQAVLKSIGKRMQDLRKKKGYKNYELFAYENELPRAQYGRYERGQDLKISSLLKVLNGFDITLQDFFKDGFDK
jgi:transcriptional regulator with XRE-family HTH domain